MRLKPVALGIGLGSVWGISLFITTLVSYFTGYGRLFLEVLAQSIYPGYSISPSGSLLGLFYGFIDGLISGFCIAWIYNKVQR
jgi:hypothetical protein